LSEEAFWYSVTPTLEEVLLLLDVHHLGEPRERVAHAGRQRSKPAAFEATVRDVVDVS
jgi:hypothetical protein